LRMSPASMSTQIGKQLLLLGRQQPALAMLLYRML